MKRDLARSFVGQWPPFLQSEQEAVERAAPRASQAYLRRNRNLGPRVGCCDLWLWLLPLQQAGPPQNASAKVAPLPQAVDDLQAFQSAGPGLTRQKTSLGQSTIAANTLPTT